MTYIPPKSEWFIFKRCENTGCGRWRLKRSIKPQKIFVKQLNQFVTSGINICGRCRKVVEKAIKERNV